MWRHNCITIDDYSIFHLFECSGDTQNKYHCISVYCPQLNEAVSLVLAIKERPTVKFTGHLVLLLLRIRKNVTIMEYKGQYNYNLELWTGVQLYYYIQYLFQISYTIIFKLVALFYSLSVLNTQLLLVYLPTIEYVLP